MRLLLVEDDAKLADVLFEALTDQKYFVDVTRDGEKGWDLCQSLTYDLILLDITLPKLDGLSLCQRLRMDGCQVPLLMLSARDTQADKIIGLDSGADDYVVKPFDLKELLARIRALLRRGRISASSILEWGDLYLDPATHDATFRGYPIRLTPKEFSLLALFLRSGRRVLSRTSIIEHIWTLMESPEENTVKAHIKGLRQKLKIAGAPSDLIETVHGVGYRLKQF